jgi:hypothetical protein
MKGCAINCGPLKESKLIPVFVKTNSIQAPPWCHMSKKIGMLLADGSLRLKAMKQEVSRNGAYRDQGIATFIQPGLHQL